MENTDSAQHAGNAGKYTFSTPAVWATKGGQFWGVLGLTAAGRLEFALKDGKLIFSAPLALVKYRSRTSQVFLSIVVGPRTYKIQFFVYYTPMLTDLVALDHFLSSRRQGNDKIKTWQARLAEFTPPPADSEPIVAARLPRYLASTARLGRKGMVFFVCYSVAMGIAVLVEAGLSQTNVHPPRIIDWTVAIGIVAWLIGGNILFVQRRKKLIAIIMPTPSHDDLTTSPEDILPPGTPPTGRLGMSTAVAYLLGLVLAGAIFGLPYLVMYLVSATGH
ncbi:MAG TPA: hypothetical protein VLF91_05065 [Candidatus Saccharimonadales bacterium]|nr:hypothetical protein [Candidatus Saccharimonadales bacterium]